MEDPFDEVASIVQIAKRELERYDKEVYKIDYRGSLLAAQRKCVADMMLQTQALLSPNHKIPDDILRRIFDDSCDKNQFEFSKLKVS